MADESGWLDKVVDAARERAAKRVAVLRAERPADDVRAHAERLVKSFSRKAGLGGAATATLSLIALPVGLPAGIALTLGIEAELLMSLLTLYAVDTAGDAGRVRLYALWAGAGAADVLKNAGLSAGANAIGKVLAESLPAKLIGKLHPALVKLVLRRTGLGWVPRVLKLWPIVGAPIGYVIDASAVAALGRDAIATLEAGRVSRE